MAQAYFKLEPNYCRQDCIAPNPLLAAKKQGRAPGEVSQGAIMSPFYDPSVASGEGMWSPGSYCLGLNSEIRLGKQVVLLLRLFGLD
jgi:hypothetical protein